MQDATQVLRAGCKINLFLEITGVRDDGYHTLESLFLPLPAPFDEIHVRESTTPGLSFSCSILEISRQSTTLHKAYTLFAAASGQAPNLDVFLQKGIPHGAGLGGGSADAAVFLRYLNSHIQKKGHHGLNEATLHTIATQIGADVPFFLINTPALVTGIGEILSPVASPVTGMYLVLLCPSVHIATPWAFSQWDKAQKRNFFETRLTFEGDPVRKRFVHGMWLKNNFESVVFQEYPELRQIKEAFLRQGAAAAVLSGSGSSIFGLFTQKSDAKKMLENLRKKYRNVFYHAL